MEILWTRSVPSSKAHIHPRNTWASATPATDGHYVYALFWNGSRIAIYAFDFQGNQIWKHELGGFTSQHGPGFSPIVHAGKVIINNDQDGKATLLVAVTPDLSKKYKAGDLVKELSKTLGGRGGGKPELAQAGGGDPAQLDAALARAYELVRP